MAFLCHRNNQFLQFYQILRRNYCVSSFYQKCQKSAFQWRTPPTRSVWSSPKPCLYFDSGTVTQSSVTDEIHFFRETSNGFKDSCFSDQNEPYGPPLAILIPFVCLNKSLLKGLIEFYGEKGFDVLTVNLTFEQLLFPCRAGGAMNVVTDLLEYLKESHLHRPYVFHGFSVGVYMFGEILAQLSDHYEAYRAVSDNVKGCLWDSPVDIFAVKSLVGKYLYPRNWIKRWKFNCAVRRHFKEHPHDSVDYWFRAWSNFCHPMIKVPNVFFVSCNDVLSNPKTLQRVHEKLEYNGIPIFQKIWLDSRHAHHFEYYWYEYLYGMLLFFELSNLFPDKCEKYKGSYSTACFTYIRQNEEGKNNYCVQR